MTGKTDFSKINAELDKLEDQASRYKDSKKVEWWNLKKGDNSMYVIGGDPLFHKVTVFHGYADSQGKKRAYQSSQDKYGECPLLENYKKLKDSNPERAKEVRPQTVYLYNVRDENGKNRVLSANTSQHKAILGALQGANLEGVDATDLREGYKVIVSRLAATPWATARLSLKPVVLNEADITSASEGVYDLENLYQDFPPEKLQAMLNGEDIINTGNNNSEGGEGAQQSSAGQVDHSKPAPEPEAKQEAAAPEAEAPAEESAGDGSSDDDINDIMNILNE